LVSVPAWNENPSSSTPSVHRNGNLLEFAQIRAAISEADPRLPGLRCESGRRSGECKVSVAHKMSGVEPVRPTNTATPAKSPRFDVLLLKPVSPPGARLESLGCCLCPRWTGYGGRKGRATWSSSQIFRRHMPTLRTHTSHVGVLSAHQSRNRLVEIGNLALSSRNERHG